MKLKQGYLINLNKNGKATLMNQKKCLNYRLYKKEFCFENYFNILPLPLSKYTCKFRCLSHKLPIEKGRFLNIERNERICLLCNKNELGDEFHYLFNCEFFHRSRIQCLPIWSFRSPNSLKFEKLMNSDDRAVLTKLALFIKIIFTKFQ